MNQAAALAMVQLIVDKYHGIMEIHLAEEWVEVSVPDEHANACAQEIADVVGAVDLEYETIQ